MDYINTLLQGTDVAHNMTSKQPGEGGAGAAAGDGACFGLAGRCSAWLGLASFCFGFVLFLSDVCVSVPYLCRIILNSISCILLGAI